MHKCTLGRVIEFWLSVFKSCHYCSTSSRYEKSFDKDESSAITQMGLLILQKSVRASRFSPPRDFSKTIKPWFFELFFGVLPFCSLKQTWMAHRGHSTLRRRHETHSTAPHCFFCCFWYCSFILHLFIFPYFYERLQHWRLLTGLYSGESGEMHRCVCRHVQSSVSLLTSRPSVSQTVCLDQKQQTLLWTSASRSALTFTWNFQSEEVRNLCFHSFLLN